MLPHQLNESEVLNQRSCLACAGMNSSSTETWPRESFDSKDPTPDNWLDEMEETSFKGINDKCHLHISSGVLYIRKYSWGKIPVQNTSMPPSFTGS